MGGCYELAGSGARLAAHRILQQRLDLRWLQQSAFGLDGAVDRQHRGRQHAVFGDVTKTVEVLNVGLDSHCGDDGDHAPSEFIGVQSVAAIYAYLRRTLFFGDLLTEKPAIRQVQGFPIRMRRRRGYVV